MAVMLDSTLREGELQPGVYFTRDSRVRVARALAETGTSRIEFPLIYPSRGGRMEDVKDAVDEVQGCYSGVTAVIHARTLRKDVEMASAYGAKGCAIYMAPTALHRRGKFHGMERQRVIEQFVNALELMRDSGFVYRRATVEDASRFEASTRQGCEDTMEFLESLLRAIEDAGATIVSVPDTSGILPLNRCVPFLEGVKRLTTMPLACHFHNDYGNAFGNAIQAITVSDVEEVAVSILGLGARNGITDHYELVANAEDLYDIETGENRGSLRRLYETFVQATGIPIPWNHPLAPQCFMEKAGTHQSQVVKDPRGYIPSKKFELDAYGEVYFEAGQFMSRHVVAKLLEGYAVSPESIVEVTNAIAARSALRRRGVSPWELKEMIEANLVINVPIERITRMIRGPDQVYIMLSLVPQFTANELLRDVGGWDEVERIDEVYGDIDAIVLSRMKDSEGRHVVDKIRNRYKEAIVKIVALPVE